MSYYVETPLRPSMVEQLGKEETIARITLDAWHRAITENHPKRSVMLLSVEERESIHFGMSVQALRFEFEVT